MFVERWTGELQIRSCFSNSQDCVITLFSECSVQKDNSSNIGLTMNKSVSRNSNHF